MHKNLTEKLGNVDKKNGSLNKEIDLANLLEKEPNPFKKEDIEIDNKVLSERTPLIVLLGSGVGIKYTPSPKEEYIKKEEDLLGNQRSLRTIHSMLYHFIKYQETNKKERPNRPPEFVASRLDKLDSVFDYLTQIVDNKRIITDSSKLAINLNTFIENNGININKSALYPTLWGPGITVNVNGKEVVLYSNGLMATAKQGGNYKII